MKWDPHIIIPNREITEFWSEIVNRHSKIAIIQALGFDPRMNSFSRKLKDILNNKFDYFLIDILGTEYNRELTQKNENELHEILASKQINHSKYEVQMWDSSTTKRRVGPNRIKQFLDQVDLKEFDCLVLDISSMPRAIYFSLISSLLDYSEHRNKNSDALNFFINVVENPELDQSIKSTSGEDKAEFIPGLGGEFTIMSDTIENDKPNIWFPILGESQKPRMEQIYSIVQPREICPVIPFPSSNPRRTDNLLISYRELLFDKWSVEKQNLIYASESNPFELYRNLMKSIKQYFETLEPLGGCKVAISSLSSKLLSVGAVLAAHELYRLNNYQVGLIHAGGSYYTIDIDHYDDQNENLVTLWVNGEPYNQ